MNIAEAVAARSTCIRKQVGCVLTKDNYVLSTGYNGALPNMPECVDIGCLRTKLKIKSGEDKHVCRAMHAEQNAIAAAARNGASTLGATCYVTLFPCVTCAKNLVQAGVTKIIVRELGKNQDAEELLRASDVKIVIMEDFDE